MSFHDRYLALHEQHRALDAEHRRHTRPTPREILESAMEIFFPEHNAQRR